MVNHNKQPSCTSDAFVFENNTRLRQKNLKGIIIHAQEYSVFSID